MNDSDLGLFSQYVTYTSKLAAYVCIYSTSHTYGGPMTALWIHIWLCYVRIVCRTMPMGMVSVRVHEW